MRALSGLDFELAEGEVHAVLGENGAGKSTLIKLITGALEPSAGTIEIFGDAESRLTPQAARAKGVACIYQQPALFPDLSVAENIGLRLEETRGGARVAWRAREERAAVLLAKCGARIDPRTEVRELSMPEQQLVEIACAIGAEARIVIMDEPTASLTRSEQERLFAIVREFKASGRSVIYISHRLEEVFALADRVTVLRDGTSVGTHAITDLDEASAIALMVGREVELTVPRGAVDGDGPDHTVLALTGVGCTASGVREVTLDVGAGEVMGLAGLVGAGRTELARILFGLTPADAGRICLDGAEILPRSPAEAMAHGIAYVPEDRRQHGVVLELPIAQNVSLASFGRLFRGGWLNATRERQLGRDYIDRLAVKTTGPDALAGSLSGGNQQKVALARWLATAPRLLILDEPTQGVDVGAKGEIHRLIREQADAGMAVLMISSDLPEVLAVSDRIGVMRGGRLAGILPGGSSAEHVMGMALGRDKNGETAA